MSRKSKEIKQQKKNEVLNNLKQIEKDFMLKLEERKRLVEDDLTLNKNEFEEHKRNVQLDIDKKYQELEVYKSELEQKYLDKNKELDNENNLKKEEFEKYRKDVLDNIQNEYKDLEELERLLKAEYSEKEQELILNLAREKQILINKFKSDEENLEGYKELLEEDFNNRINDLDKYEEELKQKYLDKLSESNEKLNNLKENFKIYMEQRELEFVNKMKEKEDEFFDKEQNQLRKYKLMELDLLKKENEIKDNAEILNKRIDDFTNSKKKFIKRHYISHIIYNKVKNNFKKFIIFYSIFILAFLYVFYSFEYTASKKTFVSNSITKYSKKANVESKYMITLDTSQAVLKNFTNLDDLTIRLNFSKNKNFLEHYKKFILSHNNEDFKWERFYKNETMIMKSAFDGQYILAENYNDFDFSFNPNEENDIILKSIRRYLSSLRNKNFVSVNRINILGKNNFFEYVKNSLIINSNYDYFYKINKSSQELFDNIFSGLLNSENYNSFVKEEQEIQKALNLTDYLSDTKNIFVNIINYSTVINTNVNIQIKEGNILETIDIVFTLEYQDETMVNPVPIKIRLNGNYSEINPDVSLESDKFTLNSVDLMRLSPREEKADFKEIPSIPFEEKSSTLEDLLKGDKKGTD